MNLAHSKKLLIISFSVFVTLIFVSVGLFYLKRSNDSNTTQQTIMPCANDSIGNRIAEDRTMLRIDAVDKLTPIAEEIKQKDGHEQYAACLYPLLVNAIQKNQVIEARQYYDLITVAYVEQGSYGAAVGLDAWLPEYFKTMVEGMEQRAEVINNFDLYDNPDYYPTEEELNEMGLTDGQ